MPKKEKKYNTPLDNYIDKYKGAFKLGLVYINAFLLCYGIYELYKYFSI